MPAAPLVGAVTTCPPAAFSSFTASAQALTHSIGSTRTRRRLRVEFALQARRAARHLEHAGQHAFGREPALHAGLHDGPDAREPRVDLGVAPHRALVDAHQPVDREARALALRQEFLAVGEGQRNLRCRAAAEAAPASPSRCTAPPPIEYISSASSVCARRVARREAHAVRMPGQHLVAVEQQVHRLVEGDLVPAGDAKPPALADARAASAPSPRDRTRTDHGPRGRAGSRGPCSGRARSARASRRAARRPRPSARAVPSSRGRARRSVRRASGPSCATRTDRRRP